MYDVSRVSYPEALGIIGGLSRPSKMPWYSWSISASSCITGSKLTDVKGSVCEGCYALKGHYVFPNVIDAHARRLRGLSDPRWVEAFVVVLENLYTKSRKRRANGAKENRFRWFDAGDLQSLDMFKQIVQIAQRTPYLQHWLPTREVGIVRRYLSEGGVIPSNLVVRISMSKVGARPARQPLGLPYSTVDAQGNHQCPASTQGNECRECDACWTGANVNYKKH